MPTPTLRAHTEPGTNAALPRSRDAKSPLAEASGQFSSPAGFNIYVFHEDSASFEQMESRRAAPVPAA
jgi:hypothetical protein